jgi:anti-sigma-K factor RskA
VPGRLTTLEPEELEVVAGEYVLGVLPEHEHTALERRLTRDAALAASVAAWDRRLLPLARWLPPVAPPPQVWWAIERSLSLPKARRSRSGLAFWRAWAASASLAALGLAAFLYMGGPNREPGLVAVLVDAQAQPALVISKRGDQQLRLRPLAQPPPGQARELWLLPPRAAPVSLGLIDPADAVRMISQSQAALLVPNAVVAVSLEPEGGSSTGAPTGPLVYQGVLLQAE